MSSGAIANRKHLKPHKQERPRGRVVAIKTQRSGTQAPFQTFNESVTAFGTMAPLLWKHLAASLTRQVAQMSRLNLTVSSSAASAYRCLYTLTTAPRTLLLSSARVCAVQPPPPGSSALSGPSLQGWCRHLPCIQPSAGMKTKTALKRRCKDCFFVRRRGRLFVYCKTNPRHKQRQG